MAIVQRMPHGAAACSLSAEEGATYRPSAGKGAAPAPVAAAVAANTAAAAPQERPPGTIGIGIPCLVGFLILYTVLPHYALFYYVPYGWTIEAALIIWAIFFDKVAFNGKGRPIIIFRRGWWWDAQRSYFPISLHQECEFDASKRHVFVIHPHGILGFSAWLSFAADAIGFSRKNHDIDIALATINVNFYVPFWRDVLLAMGLVDASFKSLSAALRRNRSVAVVLGGASEALDSHPGTYDIILNKRKGIIRLALSTGAALVPVFVFGETDLFYQVPNPKGSLLRSIQETFLSRFKFSPPLVLGRGLFGCKVGPLPYAVPLHIVTGTPIEVPHIPAPSDADIVQFQGVYRRALEKLYADHEKRYFEEVLPKELRPAKRPVLRIVA